MHVPRFDTPPSPPLVFPSIAWDCQDKFVTVLSHEVTAIPLHKTETHSAVQQGSQSLANLR